MTAMLSGRGGVATADELALLPLHALLELLLNGFGRHGQQNGTERPASSSVHTVPYWRCFENGFPPLSPSSRCEHRRGLAFTFLAFLALFVCSLPRPGSLVCAMVLESIASALLSKYLGEYIEGPLIFLARLAFSPCGWALI